MTESSHEGSNDGEWKYSPTDQVVTDAPSLDAPGTVISAEAVPEDTKIVETSDKKAGPYTWTAPNASYNPKSVLWYLTLIVVTLVFSAVIYELTKDKITTSVILVSGLLIGIYASKKPKMITYQIDGTCFKVGNRVFDFGSYKSFSITHEGDNLSAALVPLHRFLPYMYINFTPETEVKVTETLTNLLPKETTRRDYLEGFLKRIGF